LAVCEQDKPTFLVVDQDRGVQDINNVHGEPAGAVEVDCYDAWAQLARMRIQGGAAAGMTISITKQAKAFLTVYFEAGSVEVWDLATYTLLHALTSTSASGREKSTSRNSGVGISRGTVALAGSTSLPTAMTFIGNNGSDTIIMLRAYPSIAIAEQRMGSVDATRRRVGVVSPSWQSGK